MKKAGFFYGKRRISLLLVSGLLAGMLSPAFASAEKVQEENRRGKQPRIRVLLTGDDFSSYGHDLVSGICQETEFFYTPDSAELSGKSLLLDGGEEGILLTSVTRQRKNPRYEGTLEITAREGKLYLVNELPLETYLEYVVPSEMPAYFEEQALMAQAVCARTYAWKHMQEASLEEYGADVDDSVSYQVYGNLEPQKESTEAVENTEGVILCHEGEPVEAFYFSTSAGVTSTDEIWGKEEASPYLQSVDCVFDKDAPWRSWHVQIPWENLEAQAKKLWPQAGALLSVGVSKKSQSGAVTELFVNMQETAGKISGEYDVRAFLSPKGQKITEQDGTCTEGGNLLPSAYFTLTLHPWEGIEVEGSGYGHGVGMSQTAAQEMAKEGYSYEEILSYFFRDVTLQFTGTP